MQHIGSRRAGAEVVEGVGVGVHGGIERHLHGLHIPWERFEHYTLQLYLGSIQHLRDGTDLSVNQPEDEVVRDTVSPAFSIHARFRVDDLQGSPELRLGLAGIGEVHFDGDVVLEASTARSMAGCVVARRGGGVASGVLEPEITGADIGETVEGLDRGEAVLDIEKR
jgi:hypothetical protein